MLIIIICVGCRDYSPCTLFFCLLPQPLDTPVANELIARLQDQRRWGHTLTLKVKYASYQQITRSRTFVAAIGPESPLLPWAQELLLAHLDRAQPVRLLGLTLSNLAPTGDPDYVQLSLLELPPHR
jgi:DNA polymerase-4